jgi:hypothetical protein
VTGLRGQHCRDGLGHAHRIAGPAAHAAARRRRVLFAPSQGDDEGTARLSPRNQVLIEAVSWLEGLARVAQQPDGHPVRRNRSPSQLICRTLEATVAAQHPSSGAMCCALTRPAGDLSSGHDSCADQRPLLSLPPSACNPDADRCITTGCTDPRPSATRRRSNSSSMRSLLPLDAAATVRQSRNTNPVESVHQGASSRRPLRISSAARRVTAG